MASTVVVLSLLCLAVDQFFGGFSYVLIAAFGLLAQPVDDQGTKRPIWGHGTPKRTLAHLKMFVVLYAWNPFECFSTPLLDLG